MAGAIEGSMEYCGRCNFGIKCSTGSGSGTGSGMSMPMYCYWNWDHTCTYSSSRELDHEATAEA